MSIPHFAGQATYAHCNPLANSQINTQNATEAAQPTMNMPQYVAHQTAMEYSMLSAYPHRGVESAPFS